MQNQSLFSNRKFLFALFISLFFVFSCGNNTDKLEDKYLGEIQTNSEYRYVIDIDKLANGKAIETSVKIAISPENSGITVRYLFNEQANLTQNLVIIEGKPQLQGDIYIDLQWGIYGNMSYSPKLFKKRYSLKVK
ncbi:Uncharacterised protein [Aggregatibacter actinomycetemcomitans]|uniref:hypothetical protein n=2 Tax=Aggregatibacter actinomycetemcomitans TaxID=714 RepID=UPI0001B9F713|nr:hypothetical protein [Aggregatibacter actinomycetemcomitans]ACX81720.1 hypothetical protein D11S_0309 [Aggregatibacter actinomycetemcomitans D11S-1]KOE62239.1 hypothetical protein A160_0210890 [Aggregatibacter actinomycetemcomitans serotype e str. A160]KOE63192.1 hypothetical protein D17P2_0300735 [Aggregatibacter actinomycetemcomitans serotype c str. D17P-2]KOE65150.1 hypothetical protein SCC393_0308155 [Aggregatibacter actinomycetemcomitans serotype e str. SCC393]KOE70529.1 hypothetical p